MVEIQIILHCCVAFTFLAALATKQKYEEGSAQIVKLLVHPGQVVSVLDIEMFDKVFKEKHQVKKDIIMFTNPLLETLAIHDSSYKIKGISKPQHPKGNNSIHPKPPNPVSSPEKYSIKPPPYYITVNPPKPEHQVRSIPLPPQPPVFSRKSFQPLRSSPPSIGQIFRDLRNFKKERLDKLFNKNQKKASLPYPYTVTYPAIFPPLTPPILQPTTPPGFHPSTLDSNAIATINTNSKDQGKGDRALYKSVQ